MITPVVQRWRDRQGLYRPLGEPIDTRAYEVAEIPDDTTARAFVELHHYSGSYPAARRRYGLYRGAALVGVAVLSHPASEAMLRSALPLSCAREAKVELGRFVLVDDVPSNGESWFLARVFELARAGGIEAIVAHSDPEPRVAADGTHVFPGHIGTIYQATNAVYVGRTERRTWRLLPDGTVLSPRALTKIRQQQRGYLGQVDKLVAAGAAPYRGGDWREWQRVAIATATRAYRHPGTLRYLWALDRALRRELPATLPYPKWGTL